MADDTEQQNIDVKATLAKKVADLFTKDSKKRDSKTVKFVWIGFSTLTIKFLIGGMTIPFIGVQPFIDAGSYGAGFLTIVGAWLGREYIKKEQ